MKIVVLAEAAGDIEAARNFYDQLAPNLGDLFVDSLVGDLVSLRRLSGTHPVKCRTGNGCPACAGSGNLRRDAPGLQEVAQRKQ